MGAKKQTKTEMARNNFYVMMCHTIMSVILIAAYAIETFVKNERDLWHFAIVVVLGLLPVVAEFLFYKKNQDTKAVKYFAAYGYSIFYLFLLFTANNPLTFTYIILMIMIVTVYNERALSLVICIGAVLANIVHIVIGITTGGLGFVNLASAEIQIAIIALMAGFSIVQASVLSKNNAAKLEKIKIQQEEADKTYKRTMEIVEQMSSDITEMVAKLAELVETVDDTKEAMGEVTQGSTEIAQTIQEQTIQTQSIQENLTEVDTVAQTLANEMDTTKTEIEAGRANIDQMVDKVYSTVDSGMQVAGHLETLDEKIQEMNSIIGIINGIASKTAMLALNASIEAARAGEAGKGFAVVAGEISSMATQTKDATVHITELIVSVSESITSVVTMIREMIEEINQEKEITESTAKSIAQISESTDVMGGNVATLIGVLNALTKANTDIIESISTISGASEEVCAHASQTYAAEEDNAEKLSKLSEFVTDLEELTRKL